MADAARTFRIVPRPEEPGLRTETFACNGVDALRLALAALAASGGPAVAFAGFHDTEETWLDTHDRRVLRASLVLRVRAAATVPEAHLNRLDGPWPENEAAGGFVQSLDTGPCEDTVRDPGPVGTRVLALAGRRKLERYALLSTRVSVFEGSCDGLRVVLRHEEIRAARPTRPGLREVCRLTIEADGRAADRLDGLIASLRAPCELAPVPPFADSARDLFGVLRLAEPDLGSEDIDPEMPARAFAYVSLRRQARAFLRHEPGTRLGDDPEALHDMRVAGRRMRAAFSLFAPFLPKRVDALRRELGRLGKTLGAVRDLDVQLAELAAWRLEGQPVDAASFDAIESLLRERRAVARRRLLATLETARYERFTARLASFLRRGPAARKASAHEPAQAAAPKLIGGRYKAVRKAGDRLECASPPAEFHRLRIRAKRLRYALEFHRPLYDGDVTAMIVSLTALQDLLGEHQDAFVAIGHLEELAALRSRKLPPRARFVMGTIAARYAQRAETLRGAFAKTYRTIRGRAWRRLKASLAAAASPSRPGAAP